MFVYLNHLAVCLPCGKERQKGRIDPLDEKGLLCTFLLFLLPIFFLSSFFSQPDGSSSSYIFIYCVFRDLCQGTAGMISFDPRCRVSHLLRLHTHTTVYYRLLYRTGWSCILLSGYTDDVNRCAVLSPRSLLLQLRRLGFLFILFDFIYFFFPSPLIRSFLLRLDINVRTVTAGGVHALPRAKI